MREPPSFPARPDPFRWWGRMTPARIALVDRGRGRRFTYAELDHLADAWRDTLAALGVGAGDRVATLAGNRGAHVAILYAAHRLGAALVPLNWRLAAPELARIVANARARVVVGEGRFRALAGEAGVNVAGATWLQMETDDERPPGGAPSRAVPDDAVAAAGDAALVLYTSGSTGAPKGAILPHRQLFYNAVATTTASPKERAMNFMVVSTAASESGICVHGTIAIMEHFRRIQMCETRRHETSPRRRAFCRRHGFCRR